MSDQSIRHPYLHLGQIFLETAEFSHRADALQVPATVRPDIDIEIEVGTAVAGNDPTKGLMRIEVRTKAEANGMYNFRVAIVALAKTTEAEARPAPPIQPFLETSVLQIVYPFVREAVAAITMRGRFGPIWLQPIVPIRATESQEGRALAPKQKRSAPKARKQRKPRRASSS